MTRMLVPRPPTDAQFLALFNRLLVALREPADDTGVTQGVYWDALQDLPGPALEAGATALMREPGRRFFPTTAEWRTAAETAQRAQLRAAVQPARDEPWHDECGACRDTGWEVKTCDGSALCGRQQPHAPHEYVQPCTCRPMNRTYQRHQHFGAGA